MNMMKLNVHFDRHVALLSEVNAFTLRGSLSSHNMLQECFLSLLDLVFLYIHHYHKH